MAELNEFHQGEEKILNKVIKKVKEQLKFGEDELLFEKEARIKLKGSYIRTVDAAGYRAKQKKQPYIIIEIKQKKVNLALDLLQLKELLVNSNAKFGVLSNGEDYYYFEKHPSKGILNISSLPEKGRKEKIIKPKKKEIQNIVKVLKNILSEHFTGELCEKNILELLAVEKYLVLQYKHNSIKYKKKLRNILAYDPNKLKKEYQKLFNEFRDKFIGTIHRKTLSFHGRDLIKCLGYLTTLDFSSFTDKDWDFLVEEILNQHLNSSRGFFYTPVSVAKFMAGFVEADENAKVADIAVGRGTILKEYLTKLRKKNKKNTFSNVFGYDMSDDAVLLARYILFLLGFTNVTLFTTDVLSKNLPEKFDVIFCHPPFGFKGVELSFLSKGLELLEDNGKLIFLLPKSLLYTSSGKEFRKKIIKKFNLRAVIDLPSGIFFPFTIASAAILVLENKKKVDDYVFMAVFGNPQMFLFGGEDVLYSFNYYVKTGKFKSKPARRESSAFYDDNFKFKRTEGDFSMTIFLTRVSDIINNDYNLLPSRYDTSRKWEIEEMESQLKEVKKLSDVAEIIPGKDVSSKYYSREILEPLEIKDLIKYVRIKDLYDGQVTLESASYIPKDLSKQCTLIKKKDVLLAISGTIGKTAVYDFDESAAISKGLVVLRLKKRMNPDYFRMLLEHEYVKKQLWFMTRGEIIKYISPQDLRELKIPFTTTPGEEEKIMIKIEELKRKIKKLESQKERLEHELTDRFIEQCTEDES